jgi:hypothetical protein
MRSLAVAVFAIANILIVVSVRPSCLPKGMALEPHGVPSEAKSHAREKTLFVSLEGNDAWTGKLAEPNVARRPLCNAYPRPRRDPINADRQAF